ncbi:chemotaxis protein CheW [Jiella sp. M17.18]|uniref:chemotaxis protein CheW n=1 Tax=Jiella sp. M17.18 TaxID=3234247 RepID=UPI0034DF63A8
MQAQALQADRGPANVAGSATEIIAFEIGGQQFCVRTTAVREIRGWTQSTPLPQSSPEMMGMMNLRGTIIPIVNMAAKLGMMASQPDARSAVVVAEVHGSVVGLLVDRVADILTIDSGTIQPPPEMTGGYSRSFLTGVIAASDGMICFLDLERLFEGFGSVGGGEEFF